VRIAGGLVASRHYDDFDADVDTFHIDVEGEIFPSRRSRHSLTFIEPDQFRLPAGAPKTVHVRVLRRSRLGHRRRLSALVVLEVPGALGKPASSARLDVRVG
jgi:hypothetical protein